MLTSTESLKPIGLEVLKKRLHLHDISITYPWNGETHAGFICPLITYSVVPGIVEKIVLQPVLRRRKGLFWMLRDRNCLEVDEEATSQRIVEYLELAALPYGYGRKLPNINAAYPHEMKVFWY